MRLMGKYVGEAWVEGEISWACHTNGLPQISSEYDGIEKVVGK